MNKNTIIVNTCDAYEDVWELFFYSFAEYWSNCKYPIIINTESKSFNLKIPNLNSVKVQNYAGYREAMSIDQWGLRLKETLNACETDYITMLYDDFILEGQVDIKSIEQCINWLDNDSNIAVFYLTANTVNINTNDDKYPKFEIIPQKGEYRLSSGPAIWRRNKLIKYTGDKDTPWAWECFGSYRTYQDKDKFYCIKRQYETIYPYNYAMGGAIYRGKWVGNVVEPLIKKYKLNIDIYKRGLANSESVNNKRDLKWKIDFFLLGYKMIGFGVLFYVYKAIKAKILKKIYG